MKYRFLILFLGIFSLSAQAFIPPVPSILKEVFDAHHPSEAWEVLIRHRVEPKPGEVLAFDERIYSEKGREFFVWTGAGFPRAIAGVRDGQGYSLGQGKSFPSRSHVLVRYLDGATADEMRDILLNEQFIRRDQFLEFESGFTPEGDPQTWDLHGKYVRHPDIFLQRLGQVVAIAIAGTEDSQRKRIIYFDRGLRGVRRLEWKDGADSVAWNMEGFGSAAVATFPHRITFELNGAQVVTSDVVSSHAVKGRQSNDFKTAWRQAGHDGSLAGNQEAALKLLLSYR